MNNLDNISLEIKDDTLIITGSGKIKFDSVKSNNDFSKVVIEEGITSIGDYAFEGCRNLKSVFIPDGVGEIGESAFCKCRNLESINIPDSVKKIKGSAFEECESLKSVVLPDTLKDIGNYAFAGCKNLKIYTTRGSQAHRYAVDWKINVGLTDSPKKENKNKGYE